MGWRLPDPLAVPRWSFFFMPDPSKPMKGIHTGWISLKDTLIKSTSISASHSCVKRPSGGREKHAGRVIPHCVGPATLLRHSLPAHFSHPLNFADLIRVSLIVFALTGCSAGSSLAPAGDAGAALVSTAAPVTQAADAPVSSGAGAPGEDIASVAERRAVPVPSFNDAHFHLLNYVQEGPAVREYLDMVGDRVGRTALFGIPLQQKWDYFVSGDRAPDYYLRSDAALYYYSFVDAAIAREYLSLSEAERQRVDPMITGFNPTDMYAADHIERVLRTFPGVFAGIGEFSIHKEFVSSKITGHTASLHNPALDRILATAAEIGLVVILHCDIDNVRPGPDPDYYEDLLDVFAAHPGAAIIWAHTGLGRFVAPSPEHVELLDRMLSDPRYGHVMLDISWDEVARYLVKDEETVDAWAALIAKHPTRFLFGTDSVGPADWEDLCPDPYDVPAIMGPSCPRRARPGGASELRAHLRRCDSKGPGLGGGAGELMREPLVIRI